MILGDPSIAIWPADWSQFIPDAILTAVTGAAVGYALWRLQAGAESRAEKRVADASWQVARTRVAWALPYPEFALDTDRDDSWLGLWERFENLEKLGAELPIAAWSTAVTENVELVLTRDLLVDTPKLRRLAVELDDLLDTTMVNHGVDEDSVDYFRPVAWITLRGLDTAKFRRRPRADNSEMEFVRQILADPLIAEKVTTYLELEERMKAASIKLTGLLETN